MGKRGQKVCLNCQKMVGCRSLRCIHCNQPFEKRVKIRDPNKPDRRGRKICPDCTQPQGVRTKYCKSCGYKFTIKKNTGPIPGQIMDWRSLTQGTRVRVVGGSGPYYEQKDGERNYTTNRGRYIVRSVDERGLHVVGDLSSKSADAGYSYLYMGPLEKSPNCENLWRDACKIVKV